MKYVQDDCLGNGELLSVPGDLLVFRTTPDQHVGLSERESGRVNVDRRDDRVQEPQTPASMGSGWGFSERLEREGLIVGARILASRR